MCGRVLCHGRGEIRRCFPSERVRGRQFGRHLGALGTSSSSIMQMWYCISEGIWSFIIRGVVDVVVVAWARKLGDGEAS